MTKSANDNLTSLHLIRIRIIMKHQIGGTGW